LIVEGNVGIGNVSSATYKLDVTGKIRASEEIISTAVDAFRAAYGAYGFFIRQDSSSTYFLLTNSGDPYGTYNALRPIVINNSTGVANISGNAATATTAAACSGNAATATKLATARTIGGVSFDGSAAINLPGVNTAGNQNTSGSSASCTGNAASATYASAVTLTADNLTAATNYPLFASAATGNLSPRTDTGFTYNPSTGVLTSTTFAGALSGNATTSSSCTGNAATATTAAACTGNAATATTAAACTGNAATATTAAACTGNAATATTAAACTGNAATATNATNHIADVTNTVHGATSAATASKIIARDANGEFASGAVQLNSDTIIGKKLVTSVTPASASNWYRIATFSATNVPIVAKFMIYNDNKHTTTSITLSRGTGFYSIEVGEGGRYTYAARIINIRVVDMGVNNATYIDVQFGGSDAASNYTVLLDSRSALNSITLNSFVDQGTTAAGITYPVQSVYKSWGGSVFGGVVCSVKETGFYIGATRIKAPTISTATPTGGDSGDVWYQYV
jgi:hypothetical protein